MTNVASTGTDRPFILCADDYGYRPGVSAAIRRLASMGRLSATSALVTFPDWAEAAASVGELAGLIDVGLHLNFVEGKPLGPMPRLAPTGHFPRVGRAALGALLGRLDRDEIRDETLRQVQAFERASGRLPDFFDGHQHAHAFPMIAEVIIGIAAELKRGQPILVRNPSDTFRRIASRRIAFAKASGIALLTRGLATHARQAGIATNQGFSGIYDLSESADLAAHFSRFLDSPGSHPLIMCHPGDDDDTRNVADPIRPARRREAAFLASDGFAALLAAHRARLERFTVALIPAKH